MTEPIMCRVTTTIDPEYTDALFKAAYERAQRDFGMGVDTGLAHVAAAYRWLTGRDLFHVSTDFKPVAKDKAA